MFKRISKNGYQISGQCTQAEYHLIANQHAPVRCIICNSNTAQHFRTPLLGRNNLTVNNKVPDDVFYFNRIDKPKEA